MQNKNVYRRTHSFICIVQCMEGRIYFCPYMSVLIDCPVNKNILLGKKFFILAYHLHVRHFLYNFRLLRCQFSAKVFNMSV